MTKLKLTFMTVLITLLPALNVAAQVASETRHFGRDGVTFDYPVSWKTIEGSSEESIYVELATVTKDEQVLVYWHFAPNLQCEFEGTRKRISRALADRVGTQIRTPNSPPVVWEKTTLSAIPVEHAKLRGSMNGTPVTAEIYSFFVTQHFVDLIYLKLDSVDAGKSAWETIKPTLTVTPPLAPARGKPGGGGVLNGKAIRLPAPFYPIEAKTARASGPVVVQVRVDESGEVVAVCAVSGHKLLRPAAESAASHAKFSPTSLSGKPVPVIGIIVYNFVYQ